jgi:ribosomal protein S18 acetylase RimI-like enzyme
MTNIDVPGYGLQISAVSPHAWDAVLHVYRQCEDFLALGPVATASMQVVEKDIELSRREDGLFCGIYRADGEMVGVLDYVPRGWQGERSAAFLELLMIAAPHRNQGLGHAVVEAFENEIRKDAAVRTILAGVQVNNPGAVRFWQREGYRITSSPTLMPDGTTAFGLRKDLR